MRVRVNCFSCTPPQHTNPHLQHTNNRPVPKIVNGTRRVPRGQDWVDRPYDILIKLNPRWATLEYINKIVKALSGPCPEGADPAEWKAEVKQRAERVKAQINAQVMRILVALHKKRLEGAGAVPSTTTTSLGNSGAAAAFFRRRESYRGGSSFASSSGAALAASDSEDDEAGAAGPADPVAAAKDTLRRWEALVAEGKRLWPNPAAPPQQEGEGGGGAPVPRQELDMLGTGKYLKERCKETLPILLTVYRIVAAISGAAAQVERDQGRCLDYVTRKRAKMHCKWMEMCSIIDSHRRDNPINLAEVKARTLAELEAGMPRVVREPAAWTFLSHDLDPFDVDFPIEADGDLGEEESKESDEGWEEDVDVEGEPYVEEDGALDNGGEELMLFDGVNVED